jgi:SEC-C motif domain protein
MRCPCRKKSDITTYADCCQPYHLGVRVALTAEALMRSRYAAFVVKDASYVSATWHLSTRPSRMDFAPTQEWLSLKVCAATEAGDTANVEFIARSRIGGRSDVLHEVSRFVRERGQWFYLDGTIG